MSKYVMKNDAASELLIEHCRAGISNLADNSPIISEGYKAGPRSEMVGEWLQLAEQAAVQGPEYAVFVEFRHGPNMNLMWILAELYEHGVCAMQVLANKSDFLLVLRKLNPQERKEIQGVTQTILGLPTSVEDAGMDEEAATDANPEPRPLSEILEAEQLLRRQVWYNHHLNLRIMIEDGRRRVVSEAEYYRNGYRPDQIVDTVWAEALAAAKRTEQEIGLKNLGPWNDFEWGELNGKLSALQWVLGDEWDDLDIAL